MALYSDGILEDVDLVGIGLHEVDLDDVNKIVIGMDIVGFGEIGLINVKCGLYSLRETQLLLCGSLTHDVDSIITRSWLYFLGDSQPQMCGSLTNSNDEDISARSWLYSLGEAQPWLCGSLTNSTNVIVKIYSYSSFQILITKSIWLMPNNVTCINFFSSNTTQSMLIVFTYTSFLKRGQVMIHVDVESNPGPVSSFQADHSSMSVSYQVNRLPCLFSRNTSFMNRLLLLQHGNVETNPGPMNGEN